MKVLDGLQMFAGGRACDLQSHRGAIGPSRMSAQETPLTGDLKLRVTVGGPEEDKFHPAGAAEGCGVLHHACKSLLRHLLAGDLGPVL